MHTHTHANCGGQCWLLVKRMETLVKSRKEVKKLLLGELLNLFFFFFYFFIGQWGLTFLEFPSFNKHSCSHLDIPGINRKIPLQSISIFNLVGFLVSNSVSRSRVYLRISGISWKLCLEVDWGNSHHIFSQADVWLNLVNEDICKDVCCFQKVTEL